MVPEMVENIGAGMTTLKGPSTFFRGLGNAWRGRDVATGYKILETQIEETGEEVIQGIGENVLMIANDFNVLNDHAVSARDGYVFTDGMFNQYESGDLTLGSMLREHAMDNIGPAALGGFMGGSMGFPMRWAANKFIFKQKLTEKEKSIAHYVAMGKTKYLHDIPKTVLRDVTSVSRDASTAIIMSYTDFG